VKTLQDRPRLLPVYRTTVRQLVRLPRLPAQHAPADRTARLQRGRLRDAATRRGRPGLPRHSPQRVVSHDLGHRTRPLARRTPRLTGRRRCGWHARVCDGLAPAPRSSGSPSSTSSTVRPGSPPTGSSSTRSSPTPASREALHHPLDHRDHRDRAGMRRLIPHRLHPAAATRPQLRRHPLPQLPRPMERARPRPAPLRRQPRRRWMRDLATPAKHGDVSRGVSHELRGLAGSMAKPAADERSDRDAASTRGGTKALL
jgi:hypothetical protein